MASRECDLPLQIRSNSGRRTDRRRRHLSSPGRRSPWKRCWQGKRCWWVGREEEEVDCSMLWLAGRICDKVRREGTAIYIGRTERHWMRAVRQIVRLWNVRICSGATPRYEAHGPCDMVGERMVWGGEGGESRRLRKPPGTSGKVLQYRWLTRGSAQVADLSFMGQAVRRYPHALYGTIH